MLESKMPKEHIALLRASNRTCAGYNKIGETLLKIKKILEDEVEKKNNQLQLTDGNYTGLNK